MLLENFIYVRERAFVFAYVPKVACTNWKSVFRHLQGAPDYLDARLAHDRVTGGLVYLNAMAYPEAQALLHGPSVSRYTVVRNPYSRALSAYLNKIQPYAEDGQPAREGDYFHSVFAQIDTWRQRQRPQVRAVSFELFLDWIVSSSHEMTRDEHWLPQVDIIDPEKVKYDFIGRFENLEIDAALLLTRMGCDISFPTREAIKFPSSGTAKRLMQYLDRDTMTAIEEIYAKDFRSLGYRIGELPQMSQV